MSTEQHEALKHAALLNAETWPAHMTLHKWADIAGDTIRTQHALIVQMAEAMEKLACLGNGDQPGNSTGNVIAQQALAPATQYPKGQK